MFSNNVTITEAMYIKIDNNWQNKASKQMELQMNFHSIFQVAVTFERLHQIRSFVHLSTCSAYID
jgi:hypothetical protein